MSARMTAPSPSPSRACRAAACWPSSRCPRPSRGCARPCGGAADVELRQEALGDQRGEALLSVPVVDGVPQEQWASIAKGYAPAWRCERSSTSPCRCAASTNSASADLTAVKLDAEGAEYEVLRGGRETLLRCRPVLSLEIEERHRAGATWAVPALSGRARLRRRSSALRAMAADGGVRPRHDAARRARTRASSRASEPYVFIFYFLPREHAGAMLATLRAAELTLSRHERQPEHLVDVPRARRQHRQPVEAQRDAAAGRHPVVQRGEEILVHLPAFLAGLGAAGPRRRGRSGRAARPGRSARRRRWRVRGRRRTARSAARRGGRRGRGGRAPPGAPANASGRSRGRGRSRGSTWSSSRRKKASSQPSPARGGEADARRRRRAARAASPSAVAAAMSGCPGRTSASKGLGHGQALEGQRRGPSPRPSCATTRGRTLRTNCLRLVHQPVQRQARGGTIPAW